MCFMSYLYSIVSNLYVGCSGSIIWARKWGMRFQPVKCNMMQLTKKHNKIQASYTLEGTVHENVESIKYLGVTITSDLKWNTHIRNVCTKANRTLGFLNRNLLSCPKDVKEAAYKTLVRRCDQSLSMVAQFGILIVVVYIVN